MIFEASRALWNASPAIHTTISTVSIAYGSAPGMSTVPISWPHDESSFFEGCFRKFAKRILRGFLDVIRFRREQDESPLCP